MDVIIPNSLGQGTITRNSKASYYNSTGLLAYAPINTGRVNYDPANLSTPPELLLESFLGSAANGAGGVPTEGFYNFTKTNSSVALNALKAPDGTYTAALLVESTATGLHSMSRLALPFTLSSTNTISIYAKVRERDSFVLKTSTTGVDQSVMFNLTALTTTNITSTPSSVTATITPINNGWYRCSINGVAGTGGTMAVELYNGAESYAGDGRSGMFFWGMQLESGTSATSYVPSVQTFTSRSTVASYYTSTGLLASAAINTARINYVPDNLIVDPKLLLENASTNLLLRSNGFFNTPWTQTSVTAVSTAIDPTTSASSGVGYTISDNSATVIGNVAQTITVPNDNNMYVFSVYIAKTTAAATFPGIEITFTGGTPALDSAFTFNTNTGALAYVVGGPDYLNVQSLPRFWRLCFGQINNGAGNTSLTVKIYPSVNTDASATWSVAPQGSVTVYGAQVEQALTESSYITTATTSTARAADVFTIGSGVREADVASTGLLYTNIPENDFPVWNSATTYGVDVSGSNSVIYNHVKYASLQASNTNHIPSTSPTWWSVIGATNAYAMIDSQVGTQTVGTVGGHIITYIGIDTSPTMSFLNVVADTIGVTIYSAGVPVYSTSVDMTGGSSGVPITDTILNNLPTYSGAVVRLDIYSATKAPAIGNFVIGTKYYLGSTETSPTIGITDYSVKTVDAFGNPTLTKRGYAKRMNTKSLVDDEQVDVVARLMAQVRATPCVWNANTTLASPNSNAKTSLIVYGYYKDWEIDVAYTKKSYLTCTVEGLI